MRPPRRIGRRPDLAPVDVQQIGLRLSHLGFILNVGWVEHLGEPLTRHLAPWMGFADERRKRRAPSTSTHPAKFPLHPRARRSRPFPGFQSRFFAGALSFRLLARGLPPTAVSPGRFVKYIFSGTRVMPWRSYRAHLLLICVRCASSFAAASARVEAIGLQVCRDVGR